MSQSLFMVSSIVPDQLQFDNMRVFWFAIRGDNRLSLDYARLIQGYVPCDHDTMADGEIVICNTCFDEHFLQKLFTESEAKELVAYLETVNEGVTCKQVKFPVKQNIADSGYDNGTEIYLKRFDNKPLSDNCSCVVGYACLLRHVFSSGKKDVVQSEGG